MRRRRRAFSSVAVFLLLAAVLVGAAPSARGSFVGLQVAPGAHSHPGLVRHPHVYVPGERLNFAIAGDTAGERFDAVIVVRSSGQVLSAYDNVAIPSGLILSLGYLVPGAVPDGDDYEVEVGDANWIESGRTTTRFASQPFAVQEYDFTVSTDREAYLGGDVVRVRWAATMLRDGSPAPDGRGQLWVHDTAGVPLLVPSPFAFTESAGSRTFTLPDLADPARDGVLFAWFNDTAANPNRHVSGSAGFALGALGVLVSVPGPHHAPGDVTVEVRTIVTDTPASPSPSDPPEPGIIVDVEVWEVRGGPILRAEYSAWGLVTDERGYASHGFTLNWTVPDGTTFEVRTNATHRGGIWRWRADQSFLVTKVGFILELAAERAVYRPGSPAILHYRLTPRPPGDAAPGTLELEFGLANGPLTSRTATIGEGDVTYAIPAGTPEGETSWVFRERVTGTEAILPVAIDGTPPTIGAPTPQDARVGETLRVRVTVDDGYGVRRVLVAWSHTDGSEGLAVTFRDLPLGPNVYVATLPPPGAPGILELRVEAWDVAGNLAVSDPVQIAILDSEEAPPSRDQVLLFGLAVGATGTIALAALVVVRRRRLRGSPPRSGED